MDDIYKLIVDNARDGIVLIQDEMVKYANPYVEEVLGYEEKEVKGMKFLDLIAQESKEEVLRNYQKTIRGEESTLYEAKIKTKNGDLLSGEIHAHRVSYEGKPADLAVIRNVKARKKTEEVLRRQEVRFRAVTDHTPDIIARFDEEGRYVYVNSAAEREFGIPRKDFFWKTDKDLGIDDERAKIFREAIRSVFETKEKKNFYSQAIRDGKKKYYYTIFVPEFFSDGTVNSVLSITRDITEIKEIDQAKSEFISITTHQLRSPLSIINWCALSLLKGDAGELSEEQRDYLEKMYDSARNLIRITDAFLNTTMLDLEMFAFRHKHLDVSNTVEEVVKGFKEVAGKKEIEMETACEDSLFIETDERVLKIILRGLISNAIEYTPKQGNVEIYAKKEKGGVVIKVGDSGCGVSDKDKRKIFSKFYRSQRAKEEKAYGTGLDLYLIKSLIKKLGGSIDLQSPNPRFNKGTIFTVKIPSATEEENEV